MTTEACKHITTCFIYKYIHGLHFALSFTSNDTHNQAGMKMKKIMIVTIVAVSLILGFIIVDFGDSPSTGSMPDQTMETTYAPEVNSNTFSLSVGSDQGDSIFSSSSIMSLFLVVIGIVAFRRNSYV